MCHFLTNPAMRTPSVVSQKQNPSVKSISADHGHKQHDLPIGYDADQSLQGPIKTL